MFKVFLPPLAINDYPLLVTTLSDEIVTVDESNCNADKGENYEMHIYQIHHMAKRQ